MTLTSVKHAMVVLALTLLAATRASAEPILIVSGGLLVGATDVEVLGTLYDVEFVDGACIAVFDGCDELSDFTFTTKSSATAAAQALLDQVFTFYPEPFNIDQNPRLTIGCQDPLDNPNVYPVCYMETPFALPTASDVWTITALNVKDFGRFIHDAVVTNRVAPSTFGPGIDGVWARWLPAETTQPPSIPEPSSLLLLGTGAVGLARRMRVGRPRP